MRSLLTLISALAAITVTNSVVAADVTVEDASTYVVKGAERAAMPMTATADGKTVTYAAKIVAWPTATVKELTFKAADGGVAHPITDEKTVYVLEGSVQTTVNGETVTLGAGDLASMPSGMLANPGMPTDAKVIAWTADSLTPGATPAVVRGADVKVGGNDMLVLKRYEFPGNSVRVVTQRKGLKLAPNTAKTDSLIYITHGKEIFIEDGTSFEVVGGDFLREVAGVLHGWDVTEESGFVTTSALPIGAGPIDPSKATDVPKEAK